MDRYLDVEKAIKLRKVSEIISLFIDENKEIRAGYKTENYLWDYKEQLPGIDTSSKKYWAEIAKDVLAFHNNYGGLIFIGINDKNFRTIGINTNIDGKIFNDKIRKWIGDTFWVEFHKEFINDHDNYIGIAIIPPTGPRIKSFTANGPEIKRRLLFRKNESAIRVNDQTKIISEDETKQRQNKLDIGLVSRQFVVNEPYFRILNTEYSKFIFRKEICNELIKALKDDRCTTVSLVGIGGIGKTAAATWSVIEAYHAQLFDFIVSITAKDRELSIHGISSIKPSLSTFENLLDTILDVLGFPSEIRKNIKEKESLVKDLIYDSNGLLFIDNLETVDDPRIISFIENLPKNVKALTTSRRQIIRKYVFPIDVFPFEESESIEFIDSLANEKGLTYINNFSVTEKKSLARSCDNIPLGIKWILRSSVGVAEAIKNATDITQQKKKGEELLEFSFRRVFDKMNDVEQKILKVIAIFSSPIIGEAICIGAQIQSHLIDDSLERLEQDTIVYKVFQEKFNDYTYTILPITRSFINLNILEKAEEFNIRKRLTDWYSAKDIKNPTERMQIQKIRQGEDSPDLSLVNLGKSAETRGDIEGAESHYKKAIERNPSSYKACFLMAELLKKYYQNFEEALHYYEQAANYAPRTGPEKALIYREWGLLYRKSGYPNALDKAIEKISIALSETPNDEYCVTAIANLYNRKGQYRKIPELLEPLLSHSNPKTREMAKSLLLIAYEKLNEVIKLAELKALSI
jgi:tetratricopeptide (TPR) repeat protein